MAVTSTAMTHVHSFAFPRLAARNALAQPRLTSWRARPRASKSGGTFRVITEPEAT